MGFLDDIFDIGVIDFNGDGKKDFGERLISYKIMEECLKEEYGDEESDDDYLGFDLNDYDLDGDLEDYDTEDEELNDESDYDWNDYDLEDAIIIEAENPVQRARPVCICPSIGEDDEVKRFINQHPKTLIAAKYLTSDGDFLYAQAIKDNFELPCSLPDELHEREMEFKEIIWKIAVRDVKLSFDVWAWCMEKFLPYREYDSRCCKNLLENVLYDFYRFPDDYWKQFVHYLSENAKFCSLVMTSCEGYINNINRVICEAIREELFDLADALFKNELEKSKHDWKSTCDIIDDMVFYCSFYDDLEPMEYFRDKYIPLIKELPEGLVHDKIWEVQPEIQKFIDEVETKNPKYAYTRRNAWRKNVSDEEKALENPLYYSSEEEYKQAVHEAKYRWRITTIYSETYGLNPENFETEKEFQSALDAAREKHRKEQAEAYRLQRKKTLEERRMKAKEEKALAKEELEAIKADKNVYIYCSVLLPRANKPYWFRSDDESVEIGDMVLVPLGEDDREVQAKVVSVGKFLRIAAPYPVEETKLILGKI